VKTPVTPPGRRRAVGLARHAFNLFWLPAVMYAAYAVARLNGVRGETDLVGISAVMRIVFLSFGGSVAYFLTLLACWEPFASRLRTDLWSALTWWFLAMIADDAFMIHETIGFALDIQDSIPMLLLGVALLIILAIHRQRMIIRFWQLFAGFAVLAIIAVIADMWTGKEGTIEIGTFDFDYEQFCELLAVLLLVIGVSAQAIDELHGALEPVTPPS
jgi:hypothetical protein